MIRSIHNNENSCSHGRMRIIKKVMLFSILMLFAGVVSALGTTAQNDCACSATQEVSSNEKLVNAQDIMKAFEQGKEKVKVIVNLAEPPEIRANVRWKSKDSLQELHGKIKAIQLPVLAELSKNEFKLRHRFENQAGFSGEVTLEALEKLIDDPHVVSIEPVYILQEHLAQGVPLINASAYRSTYNGQGVAIAICDSGIDYYHPKLGGGAFPNSKVIGGYDFGDNDSDPYPNGAHGTACGGIAAGDLGSTGDYIGGVAYGAKLYALKAKDSSGDYSNDSIIAAWDWCVSHKNDNPSYPILVISTSVGGGRYFSACDSSQSAFATAANNAVAAGITVLVSSGNEGYCDSISSPACLSNVISAGAVYDAAIGTYSWCVNDGSCATPGGSASCDPEEFSTLQVTAADLVAVYSNTASFLDVLAPADDAYTTDITGSGGYWTGDYYPYFGGTSAACPYAAGTVACLQSAAKECTGSYLSPSEVRSILTSTGDDIADSKVAITKPRINLGQAIDSIIGGCTYCSASGGCDEYISRVEVGDIDNSSGCDGYGDYTYMSTTMEISQSYHIKVTNGNGYSSDKCGIWLDWNQDKVFDHPGELVLESSGYGPYEGDITVPGDANLGDTRIRIRIQYAGTLNPCGETNYGEVEDYTITGGCTLDPPVLHAEPNITPGLRNTISWDPEADADGYYAQCANDANFANTVTGSGWISETNCTFTGLELGQTYWYRVKATPQFESWSQTSQVDFETDTLTDTRGTADGNVVLAGGGGTIFQDDFEDGNYDGWIHGSSSCTREVVDDTAAAGTTYSFTQTGPCSSYQGVHYTFAPFTPDRVTFYVRTESTEASGYVVLVGSDTSHRIVWFYMSDNIISVYQDKTYGTSCNLLTWYKVDFVFNWQAKTFAFYVDDGLIAENIPFRDQGVNSLETIYLHDLFGTQSWWDEIEFSSGSGGGYTPIGDIVSTAINLPAGGSWDVVDFNTTRPANTELTVDILDGLDESVILADVNSVTDISWVEATELKLRANLSTDDPNNTPALHDWSVSYVPCESDWSNVESSLQCDTLCDFDNNNEINFIDFAILAGQWLQVPGSPSADIAPEVPNNFVDFLDLSVFVENWLLDLTCTVEN